MVCRLILATQLELAKYTNRPLKMRRKRTSRSSFCVIYAHISYTLKYQLLVKFVVYNHEISSFMIITNTMTHDGQINIEIHPMVRNPIRYYSISGIDFPSNFHQLPIMKSQSLSILYIIYNICTVPIRFMCHIFPYICHNNQPNVGKYTIVSSWILYPTKLKKSAIIHILSYAD